MGKKSYWFKDLPTDNGQKGNFSNNKQDTFNPQEGFIGTRLQQGVPLLDRDWNELEDIRRYQDVMLRQHYLGDGTPNDGFRVSALDPLANDFMISAGRFLVEGLEAVNEPAGAKFILYSSQGLPALTRVKATQPPNTTTRNDTVYLDIWIEEVTGKELPRLTNPDDVAMETCIRHRLRWFVRVDEGSLGHSSDNGHHFYDLARITRTSDRDTISSVDIKNLRPVWQTLQSLNAAQSRLKNAINSLISGSMPSDPTIDLATLSSGSRSYGLAKDLMGNMILFWSQDNNIWTKRYNASTRTWGVETLITSGTADKYFDNAFYDSRGDIWVFWGEKDSVGDAYNFRAKRYSTNTGIWTGDIKLTSVSGTTSIIDTKSFEDNKGNVWFFWNEQVDSTNNILGITNNILARKYTSGSWSENTLLTTGALGKSWNHIFYDSKGAVWIFWDEIIGTPSKPIIIKSNYLAKRFSGEGWSDNFSLTPTGGTKSIYSNSFEDRNGIIWFFWAQSDDSSNSYNIWSKMFTSGSWTASIPVTSVNAGKINVNSFVDARGDVWLIWQQLDAVANFWQKRYTSNAWSQETQLTKGSNPTFGTSFAGTKRDVWILYTDTDLADSAFQNTSSQRFNFDTNAWETQQIYHGKGTYAIQDNVALSNGNLGLLWSQDNLLVFSIFSIFDGRWLNASQVKDSVDITFYRHWILKKSNGEIWLLQQRPPYDNLWCMRFIDGDWVGGERLTSGESSKATIDVLEDFAGDVWAFWITNPGSQSIPSQIKAKKIYGSI